MRTAIRDIVAGVIILGLVVLLFSSTLAWLVYNWMNNSYYSHGFLVPLISGFFLWRRRDALGREGREPDTLGLIPLALGLVAFLVAQVWQAYHLSGFAFVLLLSGLALYFLGEKATRRIAFPLAFLLFMIPLPFINRLSPALESFTATMSTSLVSLLGIPASNIGSQIQLPNSSFVVGAACSGLNSVVALATLVVIFVYIVEGSPRGKIFLLAMAIPIAVVANIFRVSSLFVIAHLFGAEAGMTYFHDYSSPVLFLLAFALLILVSRLVGCSEIRRDI
ncbi:MAG: exosortase [Anaerolineae bacterium]|nr:exosortase [Anaerolineae bacterium]NIN96534.1 exosortase [Anaerolineae bacterium]NIQ79563.1 exosortase [Anaerolineae bacterium]